MSVIDAFQEDRIATHYRNMLEPLTAVGAAQLVRLSGIASDKATNEQRPLRVLDNAAGTGIVTSLLLSDSHPLHKGVVSEPRSDVLIDATDNSQGMCSHILKRAEQESWPDMAFKVTKMDSQVPLQDKFRMTRSKKGDLRILWQTLTFPDEEFDYTIISYGAFLFIDPMKGLKGAFSLTKPLRSAGLKGAHDRGCASDQVRWQSCVQHVDKVHLGRAGCRGFEIARL